MNGKKGILKWMLVFIFVLCTFLIIRGCSTSKNEKKLLKRIEVQNWDVEETEKGIILTASVKMPDYRKLLLESYEQAEKGLFSNEKKFEKKLYKIVEKKAKKEKLIGKTITVNITRLDEKVNVKSERKLKEFIIEYALEQELEVLCVEILNEGFQKIIREEAAQ